MARLVEIKIGKKIIKKWDRRRTLFPVSEEVLKIIEKLFSEDMRKILNKERKNIRIKQKRVLDYLEIYNKKLLGKMVKYCFNKFLDKIYDTPKEDNIE